MLVAAASLHGATDGIAETIAAVLQQHGLDVEVSARGLERDFRDWDEIEALASGIADELQT